MLGFKQKVLNWLRPFGTFCFLDNHDYSIAPHSLNWLIGVGSDDVITADSLQKVDSLIANKQWLFGHICYEALHGLFGLAERKDATRFPPLKFFVPHTVLALRGDLLTIHAEDPVQVWQAITLTPQHSSSPTATILPQALLTKEAYIAKVETLRQHILRGDCYEVNFCQAFSAEGAPADPFVLFEGLMQVSPNPFSAFYRLGDSYLLCASPERFLKKMGSQLISQPIKGTISRNHSSTQKDTARKQELRQSAKDQAENVMVVDLVRNDLTRICKEASVRVDELFGIYTFPQVHQMITTVSGELQEEVKFSDIIAATFPMGSMTGAPKQRVMELVDTLEPSARGIFSGAVGYISPDGDFDLAVVIRSIMYNVASQKLIYQVGSGITFYSNAEQEWEECMLKAEAIRKVLNSD